MSRTSFTQRVAQLEGKRPPSWVRRGEGRLRIWRTTFAKILLGFVVAGFVAKALLFVGLGEATFEARREVLARGSEAEQLVAWAMQPDPVVRALDMAVAALGF